MRAIMVMLVMLASVTAGAQETTTTKSWVLWDKNAKTLYFVRDNVKYKEGKTYNGKTITNAWKIADKADTKKAKTTEKKALWKDAAEATCTKVVFEDSFSDARPLYCKDWFKGFGKLKIIKGIENLHTDEVTTMNHMFYGCHALTGLNVSGFNTTNVTDMSSMFKGCSALTELGVSGFNTANVTDMSSMFNGCSALTELDVSKFDATSVTNITSMFEAPNLKNMGSLFKKCSALQKIDMSGFNAGNVTSLASFFYDPNSPLTTIDLSGMKAPKVKNMSKMFYNCPSLKTVNLSGLDAPELTTMSSMFSKCTSLKTVDLSGINAPKLTDMSSLFGGKIGCPVETVNLSGLNAPNVSKMNSMFQGCSALTTLDLGYLYNTYTKNCKTTTAANTNSMFEGCSNLKSIFVDDRKWSQRIERGGANMFRGCNSLVGEDGTTIINCDEKNLKNNAIVYAHTNAGGLLRKCDDFYVLTGDFVTFYLGANKVEEAKKDANITIKVNAPAEDPLESIVAMCGENPVTLSHDKVNDVYTFTMPKGAVTVATTFSGIYTLTGVGVTLSVGEEKVAQAKAGTTITYTPTIPTGKEVYEVTVMQGETFVRSIQYEDGTGLFTMPAGDVTVTVTYADAPVEPVEYTLTGEDNMSFYYVDGGRAEEDENEDETSIIKAWKVWPGNDIIVRVDEPEGQAVDVLTVKQGETSLEVKTNEEGDLYFTMPAGDVTVTATYMDPFNLLSGELEDAESGERVNDYVDFYNDKLNLINEAFRGQKVWVDVNPDVIPANMYFTGVFTSDDVTIVEEDETTHYIIMPEKDVTVNAVMASQETLVLNLLTNDATETIDNRELASLMMQWEGYLVGSDKEQDNPSESYPYTCHWYFDLDGNGDKDVVLTERCINESTESTYTIQRLEGAASLGENYCLTLRSPGLPLKYKDALFNFGKSETITCVFFFEELSNKHTLANYDGKTVNVSFPERILYKDGDWNTICLPFDVTVAGSPLDGDGVTVKTLKGASLENGTLALTFTEGSETELKAGVPYLIKWTKPDGYVPFNNNPEEPCYDLYAPTFKNVTLDIILKPVLVTDLIAFDGTYTSWEYKQDSPSVLLMGAENNLYYPQNYSYLNCFRAYFQLLGGIKAIDPGLGGSIKSMVIDFGEEETDIEELKDGETGDVKNEGWYTLSGVKLAGKPSVSGIYLFNGKKVAVQ